MFEIILLFIILSLFAASFFSSQASGIKTLLSPDASGIGGGVPSPATVGKPESGEGFSFLAHLKNEIEAELFPRPTCSILQRHYDTLVAAEVKNRLALMTE